MNPRAFGVSLVLLAVCLPAHASKIVPLDLDKLTPRSELIVVGVVTAILDSDAESDTISVQVISTLKGNTDAKYFSLRLRNKGVKDFDPRLAVGDLGVFFLKSIEGGRAELAYWGSIAVIPKNGNFGVPGKPNDASTAAVAGPPDDAGTWSKANRDLEARITLAEKPAINGTRSLVPYLELRNVGSSASPVKARCGGGHVKFELVDSDGKVVRDGLSLRRSGPHADPGTVSLPHDSSIRVGMYCSNWGVPKDAAAMISTDSGAWVLKPEEKGKVFLRATFKGEEVESDPDHIWYGTIETPLVKVDWQE